ncbi:MAG: NAD(P)H-hydrate dehydratase [Myxococcota bacterium]|nr:NAD(P)H-hydrate dehydratase [Myxococcota bacterium]
MIPVSRAAVARELDRIVIEEVGLPGQVLMELAGRGAADAVQERWPTGAVAVLCGPGNNGGDGYVVARWLALWGHPVRLWAARPPATDDARSNAALCAAMGLTTCSTPAEALVGAVVVVDALLGTGQRSAPRGAIREAIQAVRSSGLPVAAMDLPTGMCADTGQRLGTDCISADLTVTFGRHKPGHLCEPGASLCGAVTCIDIGLDLAGIRQRIHPDAGILQQADVAAWIPDRTDSQAKWNRGHVAIRAGGGAAVLAAHGAFRSGAGLVTLLTPREEWSRLHGLWPEVILAEPAALDPRRHDALVIGPGLGLSDTLGEEVRRLWGEFPGALLADADALTLLARHAPQPVGMRVITPHSAEAARLLGTSRVAVEADRFSAAQALAEQGVAAVLKGPNTLLSGPEGIWVVPVRCGALGTAGSGDVLAGLIGGFLALGLSAQRAAAVGAWQHAHAGLRLPHRGTASDLIESLRVTNSSP